MGSRQRAPPVKSQSLVETASWSRHKGQTVSVNSCVFSKPESPPAPSVTSHQNQLGSWLTGRFLDPNPNLLSQTPEVEAGTLPARGLLGKPYQPELGDLHSGAVGEDWNSTQ